MKSKTANRNPRDVVFVQELVKTGHKTNSALAAYNVSSNRSASVTAVKKLKQKHVQQMLAEALEELKIDPKWIVKQRESIVIKGMNQLDEQKISPKDIHDNLTTLEKLLGLHDKQSESTKSLHLHKHLHQLPKQQLLEKRNEVNEWFNDVSKGESG